MPAWPSSRRGQPKTAADVQLRKSPTAAASPALARLSLRGGRASAFVFATLSKRTRQQRTAGSEQTIKVVGLIKHRLPRSDAARPLPGFRFVGRWPRCLLWPRYLLGNVVGHDHAQLTGVVVGQAPATNTTTWLDLHRFARLEQSWRYFAAIVERPTVRHHHRIGVITTQNTG